MCPPFITIEYLAENLLTLIPPEDIRQENDGVLPQHPSVLSVNFFQIREESDLKLSSIWQQLLLLQGQLMGHLQEGIVLWLEI